MTVIYWENDGYAFRDHGANATGWRIVALDPRNYTYFDDDHEAMDSTNWDAMVSSFDDETSLETIDGTDAFRGWFRPDVRADADWGVLPWETMRGDDPDDPSIPDWADRGGWRAAWWSLGQLPRGIAGSLVNKTVLIVREDSDAWDVWQGIARNLSNYPLLDENAFLELEDAAWWDWWERDGFADLVGYWSNSRREEIARELIGRGVPDSGWVDNDGDPVNMSDLVAGLDVATFADVSMGGMAYWHGFTGEYDDDGAVAALVDHLAAAWRVFGFLADAGNAWHRLAMGVVPLPGMGAVR